MQKTWLPPTFVQTVIVVVRIVVVIVVVVVTPIAVVRAVVPFRSPPPLPLVRVPPASPTPPLDRPPSPATPESVFLRDPPRGVDAQYPLGRHEVVVHVRAFPGVRPPSHEMPYLTTVDHDPLQFRSIRNLVRRYVPHQRREGLEQRRKVRWQGR